MDLQGKVIVITGAAQGLGQKMAEIVGGQGAKLALVDLDHAKLQNTGSARKQVARSKTTRPT